MSYEEAGKVKEKFCICGAKCEVKRNQQDPPVYGFTANMSRHYAKGFNTSRLHDYFYCPHRGNHDHRLLNVIRNHFDDLIEEQRKTVSKGVRELIQRDIDKCRRIFKRELKSFREKYLAPDKVVKVRTIS